MRKLFFGSFDPYFEFEQSSEIGNVVAEQRESCSEKDVRTSANYRVTQLVLK